MDQTNLWTLVDKDPYNPHFWTELVHAAESSRSYDAIVKAYSGFLEKFPLMHFYWNKWALIVRQSNKEDSTREAISIFDRAVAPGVLEASVDMWQFYIDFAMKNGMDVSDEEMRTIFSRAITAVGGDYDSDGIWSSYIHWEEEKGRFDNVSMLFCQVLSQPVRNIQTFWDSFVEHRSKHSIERAVTPEERVEIEAQIAHEADNDVGLTVDQLNARMQDIIFEYRSRSYAASCELISQRLMFETMINRTYFHFKPPSPQQIANWSQYLSFLEAGENIGHTIHLFERCLIPMNLCPHIWARYATFLEKQERIDDAHNVLERARNSPIWRDPEMHRIYGMFEEKIQNFAAADAIFEEMKSMKSANAQIAITEHFLREGQRTGTLEEMTERSCVLLRDFLSVTTNPVEYTTAATFLYKLSGEIDMATLAERCTEVPMALSLCVGALSRQGEHQAVLDMYNTFLVAPTSRMSPENKVKLFPSFVKHQRCVSDDPAKNREIVQLQLAAERQLRQQKLAQRREMAKKVYNSSDTMNMWIDFIEKMEVLKPESE